MRTDRPSVGAHATAATRRGLRACLVGAALAAALPGAPAVAAEPGAAGAVSVTLGGEVTLVGLTGGARAELLYRPGAPGTASRLRLALGAFSGPDQVFVPFSLGYRAQYRDGKLLQPLVGVGLEVQHRVVSDLPLVQQFGLYGEAGLALGLPGGFCLGGVFSFDLMFFGGPGFGFGPRLFLAFRPPG